MTGPQDGRMRRPGSRGIDHVPVGGIPCKKENAPVPGSHLMAGARISTGNEPSSSSTEEGNNEDVGYGGSF